MAKKIVRYLLEGDGSIPVFIEVGGFLPKNEEMVGRSVDEKKRHVPATVVRMTKMDLRNRITELRKNPNGTFKTIDGAQYTVERVEQELNALLGTLGLPDYE